MSGRETIHEVEASAALAVAVPTDCGDELRSAVAERLSSVGFVRSTAVETVGDVDERDDDLRVSVEVSLTLHFERPWDAEAARVALGDADPVVEVYQFERLAGPYEVEAW